MSKFSAVESKATTGISVSIGTPGNLPKSKSDTGLYDSINQNTCTLILHRYQ